jgi:uncharacterized LabA/DUF88 family protein
VNNLANLKHKSQRVLVLFDVQNLYYSAKHIYNTKVNFKAILETAVAGRTFIRAIAYVIRAQIKEESSFHEALENIGIEVKSKDLQIFCTGDKKGDWDIGIAMDAVRLCSKVDTIVIVSGDGDFKDLISYLKSHGCRVEVIAFSKTASKFIKDEADDFTDLGANPGKFLIRPKQPMRGRMDMQYREGQQPLQGAQAQLPLDTKGDAAATQANASTTSPPDLSRPERMPVMPSSIQDIILNENQKQVEMPQERHTHHTAHAHHSAASGSDAGSEKEQNLKTSNTKETAGQESQPMHHAHEHSPQKTGFASRLKKLIRKPKPAK